MMMAGEEVVVVGRVRRGNKDFDWSVVFGGFDRNLGMFKMNN